jgi:thiol-disulfide isomerase/thioredoxin
VKAATTTADTGMLTRLGLALAKPRFALALASDRKHAGRSGSDLIVMILMVLAATQLRGLVGSIWLGKAVDAVLGLRAAMQILTRTLTIDLAFLVLGAFVLFALAGPRRNLGRAFDLACVAAVPLLVVELAATTVIRALDTHVPMPVGWVLAAISWGWAGSLLALAIRPAKSGVAPPALPDPVRVVLIVVVTLGTALQILWIARNVDSMRPVTIGTPSPQFALPAIEEGGALGAKRGIAPGKVTVVEFWATWCKPCREALPKLERLARARPDVDVITINLDDAESARAMWNQTGFTMPLVMDDGAVSQRFNVTSIPHTVVIDKAGTVVRVFRGGTTQLEAAVDEVRK